MANNAVGSRSSDARFDNALLRPQPEDTAALRPQPEDNAALRPQPASLRLEPVPVPSGERHGAVLVITTHANAARSAAKRARFARWSAALPDHDFFVVEDMTFAPAGATPASPYTVTEDLVLAMYPEWRAYLYNNTLANGEKGICCGKPALWQLPQAPVLFTWQKHLRDRSYSHVWKVLDDAEIIEGGESILAEIIERHGDNDKTDFLGLRFRRNCLDNEWSMARYTRAFGDDIMARMARKNVSIECYSEAVHRYSRALLRSLDAAVRRSEITWAERWIQPVAWAAGLTWKNLFPCSAVEIDGTSERSSEREVLAFSKKHATIVLCPHLEDRRR